MKIFLSKIMKTSCALLLYSFYRIYCSLWRLDNQDIWLISERGDDARDNSFHLFKYIRENHPTIKIKYVITSSSADYHKVKELGEVIDYGSSKHYIYLLTAGTLISTHLMGYTPDMSLFWRLDKWGLLKLKGKRVFLQHGITKDYIPIMSAKIAKLDLFICGAMPEFEYIRQHFGYSENVVQYTGFPRFDNLTSRPRGQILLMPTFRKWLNYVEDFKESEYFKRYNSLINNPKLSRLLEECGYKLVFYPHYEIQKRLGDFQINSRNENVAIANLANFDVQELLKESDLLVTDYSSVFFDFVYMRKPVIYYQFDKDKFRAEHYNEGYFSYEDDGFGPIVYDEAELVENLEIMVKNHAKMHEKYLRRVDDFFTKFDHMNSQRVYNTVLTLDSDEERHE